MKIKLKKIVRHWWFPFIIKELIFDIDGKEQPITIGWEIETVENQYKVNIDQHEMAEYHIRELKKYLKRI